PRKTWRWKPLAALLGLLYLRAVVYWQIGSSVDWTPSLRLGTIAIPFRSDIFPRALVFSALSFGLFLAVAYFWLLLVSLVNAREAEPDPVLRLLRLQLGPVDRWPWLVKLIAPVAVAFLFWLALCPLLSEWQMVPHPLSLRHRLEEAGAVALAAYLCWKYLLAGLLALYLLSNYVYLGQHALWHFLALTGRNVLKPLRFLPLQFGKIDAAPALGIALIIAAAQFAQKGLTALYSHLPL
ncbi:MAG TPA: hypothetical protein VHH88_06250, partial [Verrucomicrobiae bacterium]|nr:hypothetical protein [Verrucomicrobiae bacterium]